MWEFWIDVGGTFTDCIGRSPAGELHVAKTLSSGATKGRIDRRAANVVHDPLRTGDPDGFWIGYDILFVAADGREVGAAHIVDSDARGRLTFEGDGRLSFNALPAAVAPGTNYELRSGEEAPIVAIRRLLGLRLDEPLPPLVLNLGTTRGTNALLERKGARTAFVTTRGFGDVLLIGNQDRPRLFDLSIEKPSPLFERAIEIDERLDAAGHVLRSLDEVAVREQLRELRAIGVESLAICLLHAWVNGDHELVVERLAREVGFEEVSVSHRLAPLIKIVPRGDTTTVDAYLNPVLREYVERIGKSVRSAECGVRNEEFETAVPSPSFIPHSALRTPNSSSTPQSALKLMTSAGGLVDASRFVGKDSILSGPAGGVVGFSRVAKGAGFERAIGFDMGGTSTDVARFDVTYEYEFETTKAGVRVVAPMLAIETVAAGGGSLCGFDGVKLYVGPESAGADPGPACYGRGGPLTVTDVNVFLGKVVPGRFPFPLDRAVVERRLAELCDAIAASPLGRRYTLVELAEGFVSIANANMARAIRRISLAKGYDPADYVLVTFGGAGGQHACAIAASLRIERVLIHPFAGILSAYGIGLADVRRHRERSVLAPLDEETSKRLDAIFEGLERAARDEVLAEGIVEERIDWPSRLLELRYRGTDATILVPDPRDGDWAAAFVAEHRRLYGYVHESRPIEVANARVEVVGRTPEPDEPTQPVVRRRPDPAETPAVWFAGEEHETPVFLREHLHAGDEITGPAIVQEPTSTIVIDPGWSGRVLERGELLLESRVEGRAARADESTVASRGSSAGSALPSLVEPLDGDSESRVARSLTVAAGSALDPRPSSVDPSPDPIRLEIFNNLFASIAEQMGLVLRRTSFSTNVKERLDFSCAVFDSAGGLVVNAPHIPVHLGAMGETVRRVLADNPDMQPGDVFVTNDPYRGGSHLPDVTVVTPVFAECGVRNAECGMEEGEAEAGDCFTPHSAFRTPHFFVASRAHHAEIGGIVPGSMPPFSRNLAEEGVLIRNFKLVDDGVSREDKLRELLLSGPHPTRNLHDNLADVAAQVAANNEGARQLLELARRHGLDVVRDYTGHVQRAAAAKMRLALAAIEDGQYAFVDHLDDGSPIAGTITIAGERATVDFTGTGPVLATNLNANRAIVAAAVLYVFRCLIAEDIPLNGGVLEPVEIVLPECLLNPPERDDPADCPAIVGGNVETSQRVVDVLLGALGVAAASQGTMNNLSFGNDRFGYYETICGGSGATPAAAGADAVHTHMTNTRLTDPEVLEHRYPIRLHEFAIRRGSGGAGTHRGGDGVVRRIEFLAPLSVSMLSERRGPFAPFGIGGGAAGAFGENTLRRRRPEVDEDLGGKFALEVAAGDVLEIRTPGGGGFGRP